MHDQGFLAEGAYLDQGQAAADIGGHGFPVDLQGAPKFLKSGPFAVLEVIQHIPVALARRHQDLGDDIVLAFCVVVKRWLGDTEQGGDIAE